MKTTFKYSILMGLISLFLLSSCKDRIMDPVDNDPPAPPTGLSTYSGNNVVYLSWKENKERDFDRYEVLWSFSYNGTYQSLGFTTNTEFVDNGAENGETYYYAVKALDRDGNASGLSITEVYASPRPEGLNYSVFEFIKFSSTAGFAFNSAKVVPYNDKLTDFFFENDNGTFYIDVHTDTDIKDMGATKDIHDVKLAPQTGYKDLLFGDTFKYVEAKAGNTYVINTVDNHYAKIRIIRMTNERVFFDWAYQVAEGKMDLEKRTKRQIFEIKTRPLSR